jgi:GTP-binding protein
MFIDEVEIYVRSGKGGDGVIHFRREKYVPFGGPDGGDGGRGGDVVFAVKETLNTLFSFRQNQKFIAENGSRGGGNNQTGRSAEDLVVFVPPGTLIFDRDTEELLADLIDPDQRIVICKGGRGGRGNAKFANSRNKAPRIAEKGAPAEEKHLRLELKLIADVGLVGVPNAGKSTLLSVVTNAKPKIAPYPFTTLSPNLGVASLDEENTMVIADIPGLIEGAHEGVGLGHDFLRHIQRTKILIHLLDGMSDDPLIDFAQINSELALFDPGLSEKPQIVAFNKMDLPEVAARWPKVKNELTKRGYVSLAISAIDRSNVKELLYKAQEILNDLPPEKEPDELPIYRMEKDPREFTIKHLPDGWRVSGESIERAAKMTYWEYYQSIRRFQRILEKLGIDQALRDAGVKVGDSVYIGDHELEWQD